MDEVDKFVEERRIATNNEISNKSKAIYDALVTNLEVNKLPEYIFLQSFFPYFSGVKPITEKDDVLGQWVSVAGTPMDEVDIIDDKGTVLFRVPPLVDTSIINPLRSENNNIGIYAIISLANQHRNNIPAVGERLLRDNLAVKAVEIQKKSEVFETNEQRWISIFARYNQSSNNSGLSTASKSNLTDDDLVF